MLRADSFAFLEELRIDQGAYSREVFSSGCELHVPFRASALNLARLSHRWEPNVGPAPLHPGTDSVVSLGNWSRLMWPDKRSRISAHPAASPAYGK